MLPSTGWLPDPIDNNEIDVPLVLPVQYNYRDGALVISLTIDNPLLPDGTEPEFIVESAGDMRASLRHGMAVDGSTGFWVTLFRDSVFGTLLVDLIYVRILGPAPMIIQETCPTVTVATDEVDPDSLSFSEETCGSTSVTEEVCGVLVVTEEC